MTRGRGVGIEVFALDLEIAYVHDCYVAAVSDSLDVSAWEHEQPSVRVVSTDRLPDARLKVSKKGAVGEKRLFGLADKRGWPRWSRFTSTSPLRVDRRLPGNLRPVPSSIYCPSSPDESQTEPDAVAPRVVDGILPARAPPFHEMSRT